MPPITLNYLLAAVLHVYIWVCGSLTRLSDRVKGVKCSEFYNDSLLNRVREWKEEGRKGQKSEQGTSGVRILQDCVPLFQQCQEHSHLHTIKAFAVVFDPLMSVCVYSTALKPEMKL